MDKPSALTNSQLLELFKSRGMKVEEADVDKLKHINYYKLKEFAYPLAKIVIVDGKVAELKDKEPENDPANEPANEKMQEPDEKDAKIAELEARVAELETSSAEKDATIEEKNATIEEKDAKIAELEATVAEQQEKLEMSAEKPAKDKVKHTAKSGALKYFN